MRNKQGASREGFLDLGIPFSEETPTLNDPDYEGKIATFAQTRDLIYGDKSWMETHIVSVVPGAPRNQVFVALFNEAVRRKRDPLRLNVSIVGMMQGDLPSDWEDHIALVRKAPIENSDWIDDEKAVRDLAQWNEKYKADYGIPDSAEAITTLVWSYLKEGRWSYPEGTRMICRDGVAVSVHDNEISISTLDAASRDALLFPIMRC